MRRHSKGQTEPASQSPSRFLRAPPTTSPQTRPNSTPNTKQLGSSARGRTRTAVHYAPEDLSPLPHIKAHFVELLHESGHNDDICHIMPSAHPSPRICACQKHRTHVRTKLSGRTVYSLRRVLKLRKLTTVLANNQGQVCHTRNVHCSPVKRKSLDMKRAMRHQTCLFLMMLTAKNGQVKTGTCFQF